MALVSSIILNLLIANSSAGTDGQRLVGTHSRWQGYAPASPSSSYWKSQSENVYKSIQSLKVDSKKNRQNKLEKFSIQISGNSTAHESYRAARYLIAFQSELIEAKLAQKYLNCVESAPGSFDVEYSRAGYISLNLNKQSDDWSKIRRTLLKLFPKDSILLKAFAYDALLGTGITMQDREFARKLLDTDLRSAWNEVDLLGMRAAFEQSFYLHTKKKSHLLESIKLVKEFISKCSDQDRIAQSKRSLSSLERRLRNKDYVGV